MSEPEAAAFTRLDLVILIAMLFFGIAIAVPALTTTRVGSDRAACVNNLARIGQAFSSWATEHGERYPWMTPASEGGTAGLNLSFPRLLSNFRSISNELVTPRILACQSDGLRTGAQTFDVADIFNFPLNQSSSQISYFLAHPALRQGRAVLSGDSNLRNSSQTSCQTFGSGIAFTLGSSNAGWFLTRHRDTGQLLFNDGSVESLSSPALPPKIAVPGTDAEGFHYLDPQVSF